MSLQAKRELLFRVRSRYVQASKDQKSVIPDGFVAATGYRRKYAIVLLNREQQIPNSVSRQRKHKYDEEFQLALLTIWNTTNQICGKRLVPFLPEIISSLEKFGHLSISERTRELLFTVSAATVDRIIKGERAKYPKSKSLTKPGGLLKRTISVKTFSDWNEAHPGFFEADLVAHCGNNPGGSFLNTLVLTDIATGWVELAPLLRKTHSDVTVALDAMRQVMPMPLLGLDTDNGSEFINYDLLAYCETERVTFTRSRPYRKNDQAHVEQKNGNIVRRLVGYGRFEGLESWRAMLRLYRTVRLYVNFFQPSVKLISKVRSGSKIIKKYDEARTPYQRLVISEKTPSKVRARLKEIYDSLDPVSLFKQISVHQDALEKASILPEIESNAGLDSPINKPHIAQEMRRTLQWNRKERKRSKHAKPRIWNTRKDPFEKVTNEIKLAVQLNPNLQVKQLFEELLNRHPGISKMNGTTQGVTSAALRESQIQREPLDLSDPSSHLWLEIN